MRSGKRVGTREQSARFPELQEGGVLNISDVGSLEFYKLPL